MEKVLITGSSGYIGRTVLERLLPTKLAPVPLSTRLEDIQPRSLGYPYVIHCAGALRHRINDLKLSNVSGTAALVRGIANKDCRIIHLSSRAVYAASEQPLTEGSPLGPQNDPYGETKLEAERILSQCGFRHLILRVTNIYGLGVNNMGIGLPTRALRKFLAGQPVYVHSPDRPQDFLYVWDLAEVIKRAIEDSVFPDGAINAASDPSSLHDFIRLFAGMFREKSGMEITLSIVPGPAARNAILDNSLLKKMFPRFSMTSPESVFAKMLESVL